jgi:urease accessory protein
MLVTHPNAPLQPQWRGLLDLAFSRKAERTTLWFKHEGPLRIQKALYPEGPSSCHAVLIHPPGGIAAGDYLQIDIDVQPKAHAVVTTPAATKWYGSFHGGKASQHVHMSVADRLEWLPAETIVFDRAQVQSQITVDLKQQGSMVGWDLLIFGRSGSHERFEQGQFEQTLDIQLCGETIWTDRLYLLGNDALFDSMVGLDGHHALSCFWAVASEEVAFESKHMEGLRQAAPGLSFTQLHPRLIVGRGLDDPIQLRSQLQHAWRWFKQGYWQSKSQDLRLWFT